MYGCEVVRPARGGAHSGEHRRGPRRERPRRGERRGRGCRKRKGELLALQFQLILNFSFIYFSFARGALSRLVPRASPACMAKLPVLRELLDSLKATGTELRSSETETLCCRSNLQAKEAALQAAVGARDALRARLKQKRARKDPPHQPPPPVVLPRREAATGSAGRKRLRPRESGTASASPPLAGVASSSSSSVAAVRPAATTRHHRRHHRPFDVATRSPLLMFRSYRVHPHYRELHGLKLTSPTFSHGLDPKRKLCPFDLHGTCNDGGCRRQHGRDWTLSPAQVLAQLAAYAPSSAAAAAAALVTARGGQPPAAAAGGGAAGGGAAGAASGAAAATTTTTATTAADEAIRTLEMAAMEFRALTVVRQVPFFCLPVSLSFFASMT